MAMLISWPLLMGGGALLFGVSSYIIHTMLPEIDMLFWLLLIALQAMAGLAIGAVIQRLQTMAYTDGLTKVWNRHYLNKLNLWLHSREAGIDGLSVIMLDVDNFKKINDKHGHLAGDEVLLHIAQILRQSTRKADIVVRMGGDEFMILLPDTRIEEAEAVAERIRSDIRSYLRNHAVTISAGVTCFTGPATFSELIARADQALYHAKHSKNLTVCH